MRFIFQSLVLIFSFGIVYAWEYSSLSGYTIPLLGFCIFLYLITSFRRKSIDLPQNETVGIFSLTTVIVLLIFTTGKLSSPLFFLMYFLSFRIAFVFEPTTVFVLTLATIAVFLPDIIKDDLVGNVIKAGGLVLVTPLAFFF